MNSTWNLPTPPGFSGLHLDKPITVYFRHLPHWRQEGATYFVTFRLHDSLPQERLHELRQLKLEWERQHPPPQSEAQLREFSQDMLDRIDGWLDQGAGTCRLKDVAAAKIVLDALHHFDNDLYLLGSYVIMPNHVHVIVRPLQCDVKPLERILQSWKRHAAWEINKLSDAIGTVWQEESFDQIIRDEEHLYFVIQYIGRNPRNAGLSAGDCRLWIRPAWHDAGWRFEPFP